MAFAAEAPHLVPHPLLCCADEGVQHGHAKVGFYLLLYEALQSCHLLVAEALNAAAEHKGCWGLLERCASRAQLAVNLWVVEHAAAGDERWRAVGARQGSAQMAVHDQAAGALNAADGQRAGVFRHRQDPLADREQAHSIQVCLDPEFKQW